MKKRALPTWTFVLLAVFLVSVATAGCGKQEAPPQKAGEKAAQPVILGVPTALGSIEGADSLRPVQLAVEEINAQGGVSVGGVKRPLEVVSIDTRKHEPGIPTHDALAALEKLITEKKPQRHCGGRFPFGSFAFLHGSRRQI